MNIASVEKAKTTVKRLAEEKAINTIEYNLLMSVIIELERKQKVIDDTASILAGAFRKGY